MSVTLEKQIISRVKKAKRGTAFFVENFVAYGNSKACAKDIACRDNARIVPTGLYAMNILGLTTQIPLKAVYITDGAPRKIIIGNRVLIFKKATPKNP